MQQILHAFAMSETEVDWESAHADVLSPSNPGGGSHLDAAAEGFAALAVPDRSVKENVRIRCRITRPADAPSGEALDKACILLHGLNERSWDKYHDWAQAIAEKARCAVIFFPIAFHMDRSPEKWANFGIMRGVSKDRAARYPGLRQSSMANAAISERLDEAPDRFFRSGLMAAQDLGDLVVALRSGTIPGIAASATLGFFGYSIGAYLLQCLCLASSDFAGSGRRFLFCGGPFLSAMTPVSKFIMDSRAHERLLNFWIGDLEDELRGDHELADLAGTAEGRGYLAMVDPSHPQLKRREVFSDGATRVASLAGDGVMPKAAILEFFDGTGVDPVFFELPSSCTHITPFNPLAGEAAIRASEKLFDMVAEHLFG